MAMLCYFQPEVGSTLNRREISSASVRDSCPACGKLNTALRDKRLYYHCFKPRCQHVYRKVAKVEELEEEDLDPWTIVSAPIRTPQDVEDEAEIEISSGSISWTAPTSASSSSAAFRPEIFKRVQYLTQWEDRLESRRSLRKSFGHFGLWRVRLNEGWARDAYNQMKYSIFELVKGASKTHRAPQDRFLTFILRARLARMQVHASSSCAIMTRSRGEYQNMLKVWPGSTPTHALQWPRLNILLCDRWRIYRF
ncbi:hypothetical protein BX600DRAFT_82993 [Xylariales sp. PMI_506]|nr:hypothetical protein BX600DRAFT_82993 [Xylariales sp. PMI_506]